MLFLTRPILASILSMLFLLTLTVRSATLSQHLDSLADRDVSQDGTPHEQLSTTLSATATTTTSPSSSAASELRSTQESNGNRNPDPENGLIGPCVRNQCCCTAQVTDRSQCWNNVTTPCPGTMGRRRRRD